MTTGSPCSVLITGANGFVGRSLCQAMQEAGCPVRGAVRHWDIWRVEER